MLPVSWYFRLGPPAGAWGGETSPEVLLPFWFYLLNGFLIFFVGPKPRPFWA